MQKGTQVVGGDDAGQQRQPPGEIIRPGDRAGDSSRRGRVDANVAPSIGGREFLGLPSQLTRQSFQSIRLEGDSRPGLPPIACTRGPNWPS